MHTVFIILATWAVLRVLRFLSGFLVRYSEHTHRGFISTLDERVAAEKREFIRLHKKPYVDPAIR